MASLLAALITLALFSWLAGEVGRGATLRLDLQVRALVHHWSSRPLTRAMLVLTFLGSEIFVLAASCLAVVTFLSMNRHRAALWIVLAVSGGGVLNSAMKHAFHRPRPTPFFGYPMPSTESFPSGHALLALCFYGALAALCSARVRDQSLRVSIRLAAALLVLAIGFSRIYLGVHYFSDVAGGYLAASVWLAALNFAGRVRHWADG
ncbi:MAG: phosphatase PAP2 family protein [Acidobacteria bacterium]|nr:phosphatase PAP2 family protein [Acidobacteriota bacterium]